MSTVLNWLGKGVRRLRSFAYGNEEGRPKIGLALGGGFARGIAHIGVLRVLEQNGIPIDFIAGTSVGSLIAAAYASGTSLEKMEQEGIITRFRDFGRWTLSKYGMASNARLEDFLHRFTAARTFEELRIPLCIVATDLVSGDSVYFTAGEISPALRASCAYPGLFLPIEHDGRFLVDGFLTEAVPSAAVRHMGAHFVIAVHLEPGLLREKPRNTIEIIGRSFSIIQAHLGQPWRKDADIILEPEVHEVLWDGFEKTPELVAAGEESATRALPQIRAALARHAPISSSAPLTSRSPQRPGHFQ
ncbi:MAG: patatin-like phospholipase family protein [Candidatus Acidiferrales bacterium]